MRGRSNKQPEGTFVKVDGWYAREDALTEIEADRARWAQTHRGPGVD